MKVHSFSFQPIDSRMYVMVEKEKALIVDPCISEKAFALLEECHVKEVAIILTHEHYDHISGVNELVHRYPDAEVICSQVCGEYIRDCKKNVSAYFDVLLIGKTPAPTDKTQPYECKATMTFQESMAFMWNDYEVRLRETPGHSEGSICIEVDGLGVFTGDSLIMDTPVITKLRGGNKEAYENITKVYLQQLPENVYIYPGHGEAGEKRLFTV